MAFTPAFAFPIVTMAFVTRPWVMLFWLPWQALDAVLSTCWPYSPLRMIIMYFTQIVQVQIKEMAKKLIGESVACKISCLCYISNIPAVF